MKRDNSTQTEAFFHAERWVQSNNFDRPVIATPVRLKMMRILHPGVYCPAPNIHLDLSRSVRSQTPARWSMPTTSTQTEQHAIESQLQSPQDRVETDEKVNKAGIVVRSVEYVPTPIKVLRKRAAEDPLNHLFERMMIRAEHHIKKTKTSEKAGSSECLEYEQLDCDMETE
ncbi:hypothetical protein QAD02_014022 [Eretmocerus hayati]|uniref:Uncharacterized protein n=1 Tax=Eretmocerus hayati TaxID=131215 RepID=A0ACC2P3S8_9HYME|nr:hypothetical protein QAD02_014022 [Eretmocerus hayati]